MGMLAIVVAFVEFRGLAWTTDIGVAAPRLDLSALWLVAWPVWMLISERTSRAMGIPEPERWPEQTRAQLALRFTGMVVLAPLAEELMFRGLLYHRIAVSPLGLIGALTIPALLFAALHLQYGVRECLWILLDGLLFGLARLHGGTVIIPILMHVAGNSYAYYQRVPR
jgi:membrane protease YdiL (CAAX protease family)